ncbi:MAG TPA: hypothetical protein P5571_08250 [Candidatus Krumholzibacteria bacterium]|nr:hypothetical protein [Candidatus Krumholzibacteria bacterium]
MTPNDDFPLWDRDEDLLDAVRADGRPRVRVRRCDRVEVVIGRGGKAEVELDLAAIRADGAPVLRRRGGGCAVVLDPGNLLVSWAAPREGVGGVTSAFREATDWLIVGLDAAGFPGVRGDGVSDLVLEGRKVGGSCIYRTRGLVYYSTTLLTDPDLDLIHRYLPHPPREPEYRRGRAHRDFLGALPGLEAGALQDALRRGPGA